MTTQRFTGALALLGAVVVTGGCAAHASGTAYAEADAPVVTIDNPTLVEVETGVWVIRDYNEPVYFVNDDYWLYRNGAWYRSHGYDGGWVVVEATLVPTVIVHRDHRAYVHYRGSGTAQTRAAPRRLRDSDHHGQREHAGEPHGGQQDHDGRGPPNERKAEDRHEDQGEHKDHAEQHQGHDHDDTHGTDNQHRGDEGRPGGKKQEKDRGKKR